MHRSEVIAVEMDHLGDPTLKKDLEASTIQENDSRVNFYSPDESMNIGDCNQHKNSPPPIEKLTVKLLTPNEIISSVVLNDLTSSKKGKVRGRNNSGGVVESTRETLISARRNKTKRASVLSITPSEAPDDVEALLQDCSPASDSLSTRVHVISGNNLTHSRASVLVSDL